MSVRIMLVVLLLAGLPAVSAATPLCGNATEPLLALFESDRAAGLRMALEWVSDTAPADTPAEEGPTRRERALEVLSHQELSAAEMKRVLRALQASFPGELHPPSYVGDGAVELEHLDASFAFLLDVGEPARATLLRLARDRDPHRRANALALLGRMPDPSNPDLFVRALSDASPAVRLVAAWLLGEHPGASGLAALEAALKDPDASVRARAYVSLETLGRRPSPPALSAADDDKPLRSILEPFAQETKVGEIRRRLALSP